MDLLFWDFVLDLMFWEMQSLAWSTRGKVQSFDLQDLQDHKDTSATCATGPSVNKTLWSSSIVKEIL
jgi:hypothetical protein